MRQNAIIYFIEDFRARVEEVDSIIRFWVVVPGTHSTYPIEDKGSIYDLSRKYEFTAEEQKWDLSSMLKRDCVVEINDDSIEFISYR